MIAQDTTPALTTFRHVRRKLDVRMTKALKNTGLTPRQYAVLKAIGALDQPSQTNLAAYTSIDRSTLATICAALKKKGLIQRKRTREDARAYAVSLTYAGREVLEKGRHAAEAMERWLSPVLKPLQKIMAEQPGA
jgi:DNA-binding MarR family transcriptional regulator